MCKAGSSRRMLEKLFANPKSAGRRAAAAARPQTPGQPVTPSLTAACEQSRQDYCGLEAKPDFALSARRAVVTRSGPRRWSRTSKTRPETRCHKSRELCCTVWHSTFNGFMAVQTQLGRFQNGTHLFLSSLCDTARPWTKGPAEMINSVWSSSPAAGTRRTSRSF